MTRLASTGGTAAFTVSGAHGTDVVWLRAPTGPATPVGRPARRPGRGLARGVLPFPLGTTP